MNIALGWVSGDDYLCLMPFVALVETLVEIDE